MSTRVDVDAAATPRRLVLTGDVDVSHAAALHAAARAVVGGGDVVADLGGVQHLDVAATQVLLALRTALGAGGARLVITGTPPVVAEAWRRCGLDQELA
jgi:anti-anti-sigma factor